jgi:hypothetical protein
MRNYSNIAVETQLTMAVDATTPTMQMQSVAGWPTAPFTIIIDPDTISEEACLVTAMAGLSATLERGFDGTPATAHAAGATVKHAAIADDFRKANETAEKLDGKTPLVAGGTWGDIL